MRSTEKPLFGLTLIVLALTGCATVPSVAPVASPVRPAATEAASATGFASSADEAESQPGPPGLALPQPGQPFDAATILALMRASRRPGGVPDQLETDATASALAAAIWTFDGLTWTTTAVSGSCGPETCTLEIAGARADLVGEDLWVFAVSPASGTVELVTAELRALPAELPTAVDQVVRSMDADGSVAGMLLASVKWLPPPDAGRFVASYRSGGEEGSCGVDVTLDAVMALIVAEPSLGR